jgi:hypothetical protein
MIAMAAARTVIEGDLRGLREAGGRSCFGTKPTSPTCQSITSSATARRKPGILIPSTFAVFKLKLSSNL